MATTESSNLKLTLEDNNEFAGIETTAENFRKVDEAFGGLDEKIKDAKKKILVTVTKNGSTISASKTLSELQAEIEKGNDVFVVFSFGDALSNARFALSTATDTSITFTGVAKAQLWQISCLASGWAATSIVPAQNGHGHDNATQEKPGFISVADKKKLDGIETGANKTTVDNALSSTSTNPVQNKVVQAALKQQAGRNCKGLNFANKFNNTAYVKYDPYYIPIHASEPPEDAEVFNQKEEFRGFEWPSGEYEYYGKFKKTEYEVPYIGGNAALWSGAHAEGTGNVAFGQTTHAEGTCNVAIRICAHAEGSLNMAGADYSHAEGFENVADGAFSHAEGHGTYAEGNASHTSGYGTHASHFQTAVGKLNQECENSWKNQAQGADLSLFVVGNGTSDDDDNNVVRSNAFRTDASGQSFGLKAFGASGADFAEYFEWADGNPDSEDRRGKFVTLDGEKIKFANAGDFIVGVVSSMAAFIGNTSSEQWQGRYLQDIFGDWIQEEIEIPEETDKDTGRVIPAHTVVRYALNPEYDPEQKYISRQFRKEWAPVGMLGQVVVVDDGTCEVGGFCNASIAGVGTSAESGYKVMKRIDSTHVKVLVK